MKNNRSISRRRFLSLSARGTAAVAGAGAVGFGPLSILHGRPVLAAGDDDYRALVCIFLYGGADTANLIVPRSAAEYATYAASRSDLAEAQGSLLPITPLTSDGVDYGMHSRASELAARFTSGDLAVVANVGPLVAPLTKSEYEAGSVPVPARLFSHSDQTVQWQMAFADATHQRGWCGRMADRLAHLNGTTPLSTNISLEGPVPLLVGESVSPYSMSVEGSVPLGAFTANDVARWEAFDAMMAGRGHALEDGWIRTQREAIEIDALISGSLPSAPDFDGVFDETSNLAAQLRMVAQLIAVRASLGMKRQVFFVSHHGYDTHDQQLELLPDLIGELSASMGAFQQALESISATDCVTTFTASDFGRTLSSNGKGSDHGWGGHALVMGGAIAGGDIYGTMPDLALEGPDDVGEGRMLPALAVDQYAATLARWFGLPDEEMAAVFPNLGKFASADLGFFA